ncbi:thiamine pyrophosphate-dependent enzyme [Candidatus Kuenenia stuttgartensis]|uniref:thiamine pyrophosphate-dependent enzyme n=1 Tax=Kuenenia stuttgartiensis TaxID=174633 RepID=UPI001E2BEAD2|nr:thiamine pyrophosphate-dependent enzyme [Candidatus Kuenenia stuttgartiensis]
MHLTPLLLDNALATMGAGLPSALTAKLLNPGKKVLAVVGDGGFMMNFSGTGNGRQVQNTGCGTHRK